MGKGKTNWMGVTVVVSIVGIFLILAFAFGGALLGAVGLKAVQTPATPQQITTVAAPVTSATAPSANTGAPATSLSALQMDKYSRATAGSNNIDFWDLGANVADTSLTARISVPFTSGSLSNTTAINGLYQSDNQNSKDLYINGASTYYDDKIPAWHLNTIPNTGAVFLIQDTASVADPSGALVASAIGSFANFTTMYKGDTGVTNPSEGIVNLSNASTNTNPYVQLQFGNSASNSELRNPVICIGDLDTKLSGNEFTAMTLTYVSGSNLNIATTNLMPLFTQSAGTGSIACQAFPTVAGFQVGVYQINFQTAKGKFTPGKYFQVIMDDLGGYKAHQYPSANLKAATESLRIQYTG